MRSILNITHNDLDGLAAAVAIRMAHPLDHVRTKPTAAQDIAKVLYLELTSKFRSYDRIILSDCSIKIPGDRCNGTDKYVTCRTVHNFDRSDDLTEWDVINEDLPILLKQYVLAGGEFVVLDHHPTAVPMSEYYNDILHEDSILEEADYNGIKRAGSELAWRYLDGMHIVDRETNCVVQDLMALAGEHDTWRAPLGFGSDLALACELISDNYYFMDLVRWMIETKLKANAMSWDMILNTHPVLRHYLNRAKSELAEAISLAKSTSTTYPGNITVVDVGRYTSLVSHSIYQETGGIVVLTYPDKPSVSLRSHETSPVHLGKFAKDTFGGGGHEHAAGCKLPEGYTVTQLVQELKKYAER